MPKTAVSFLRPTICILAIFIPSGTVDAQEQTTTDSSNGETLEKRVAGMEKRIAHLERLLFSTAQLTVYDAQRRLDDAKTRLEQSHRLYMKGVIQQHQINHDRFLVRRAERELDLAKATDGQYRITAEIDCLQAEYNLDVARKQLEFSRSLLTRGYTSKEQIRREESALDQAQKAHDLAQQKLQTLKDAKLKGLKK